jgi:hypothetical protein
MNRHELSAETAGTSRPGTPLLTPVSDAMTLELRELAFHVDGTTTKMKSCAHTCLTTCQSMSTSLALQSGRMEGAAQHQPTAIWPHLLALTLPAKLLALNQLVQQLLILADDL